MAADPQAMEPALWHEALRQSDHDAHAREDAWMRVNAVTVLEQRLTQANADRHALREAVVLRDRILHEQQAALAERDRLVAALQERVEERADPVRALVRRTDPRVLRALGPLRPVVRLARRVLGRARRLLGAARRRLVP